MRILLPSLVLICALFGTCAVAQQENPVPIEMGALPIEVDESSGLAIASETTMWTHNDRGGKAEFYEIDIRGELMRTVKMIGVDPVDMEDMAQDESGNLYFADTGNNKQDRDKLMIYIVNVGDIVNDEVRPAIIEFELPKEGLKQKCHFDFEAMAVSRGKLYLFSKDRCDKPDNSLYVYSIPSEKGFYTAKFEGEFFWENPDKAIKITSADISVDGKKLILLANDALHFFYAYRKDEFFNGAYNFLPIGDSKKEAIVHMSDCEIYFTEESSKGVAGKVWKMNICKLKFH